MAFRYRGVIKIKTMKDKTISASLIYRKIEGKLSAVEEERFEAWLKEGWDIGNTTSECGECINRKCAGS